MSDIPTRTGFDVMLTPKLAGFDGAWETAVRDRKHILCQRDRVPAINTWCPEVKGNELSKKLRQNSTVLTNAVARQGHSAPQSGAWVKDLARDSETRRDLPRGPCILSTFRCL